MLDFLLVLGRVPGTEFYVTFTEIVLFALAIILFYEEKKHRKEIQHFLKWIRYRIGVNFRRRKRQLKSFIKYRRYRLVLAERRVIRSTKRYFRNEKKAIIASLYRRYQRLYRRVEKFEKRFKSSRLGVIYAVLSTGSGSSTRN